jgi:hypothetical protein
LRTAVKKLYQLRPNVSASRVSVASRVVYFKYDELRTAVSKEFISCVPRCLLHACLLCPESSVASKNVGIQNVKKFEGSYTVLLYEGRSEINASCFIMLAHDVRGGCWWYGSGG